MYTVVLAGSTIRTRQVATALLADKRYQISLIITPQPKKVGRQQTLTKNPLHLLAEKHGLPTVLVKGKIDQETRQEVTQTIEQNQKKNQQKERPDFLLVVDFGYLIPDWLLQLSKIAPLNIHPSKLPAWRGSSPGQFVLLHGDEQSAVTLMVINDKMDEGPIVAQLPFEVNQNWTQAEYYQHSFELICEKLADLLEQFALGKITANPQPVDSPTPTAKRLKKADAFYSWQDIQQAMAEGKGAAEIERACRAFSPWPKVWTKAPTKNGEQRMIIHQCSLNPAGKLELDQVQLAGKNKASFNEIKNIITYQ